LANLEGTQCSCLRWLLVHGTAGGEGRALGDGQVDIGRLRRGRWFPRRTCS
jgi:hypothetical protein